MNSESLARAAHIASLLRGKRVVALTGAGLSTESGIPDYRGEGTRARSRSPIQFKEFLQSAPHRERYWSRSAIGWPKIRDAAPNEGHRVLARLEAQGQLAGIITQNVDRLHHKAGAHRVVELHGALAEVQCLQCGDISERDAMQERLLATNPHLCPSADAPMAPDGDADVESPAATRVPACERCGGILKPHVVFFGESVPRKVVDAAWQLYEEADVLLVLGTSLAVYSGYRFVRRATADQKPTVIVCMGESRGDAEATERWQAPLGEALTRIEGELATDA